MTIGGKKVSIFVFLNGVCGVILGASGVITAYADTLGAARWVSVVLGGIGVVQLLTANWIHEFSSSSG